MALAGVVIASHYVRPVARELQRDTQLVSEPDRDGAVLLNLKSGAPFALLDSRGGWAWGYGGEERRVGYLPADALL